MAETIDYQVIEREFVVELNKFRSNPSSFVAILESLIPHYKEKLLYRPGEIPLVTSEGIAALNEAIESIKDLTEPLPALEVSEHLNNAARAHCNDIGFKGISSHEGTDGSSVMDRIERFCEWGGCILENLDFGSRTGLSSLVSLIVDDGIPSRGHRLNLLNKDARYIGVAAGFHREYQTCVVSDYSGSIRDKNKPYHTEEMIKDLKEKNLQKARAPPQEKIIKNPYQVEDEDAPDETVAVKTIKHIKYFEDKPFKVTKKVYTLSNGTQHIVEVEDFQN